MMQTLFNWSKLESHLSPVRRFTSLRLTPRVSSSSSSRCCSPSPRWRSCFCRCAPPLTYTDVDPVSGASLECDRCPPGTYLRSRCTSTRKSDCAPCPSGSFTELWNYIGKCLRCSLCDRDQVVKKACAAEELRHVPPPQRWDREC